ncbi:helix-turn-helix domain-containing protein [Amycolatopsis sp. FBCC-B4732]|uniref:helix-turn-helix domain-containing protein n=1 Tax=Amycolatopsis sp. FBCC-B4732 TaxID=3079339 RepID=UPI0028F4259C|nr:helix-turn-helix domain-containing protein [Amycolatopsis sp. FBCC-B4732]
MWSTHASGRPDFAKCSSCSACVTSWCRIGRPDVVGEPPPTYLTRWRMTTAARLLRETDRPLAQVASAVGYGSAFAFAFRREYATTLGGYRSLS